jgi:hypothetical protein
MMNALALFKFLLCPPLAPISRLPSHPSHSPLRPPHTAIQTFNANKVYIATYNAETAKGLHTETLGVGPWADLTNEEYIAQVLPTKYTVTHDDTPLLKPTSNAAVDWRTKGAVTPVKNQQQVRQSNTVKGG